MIGKNETRFFAIAGLIVAIATCVAAWLVVPASLNPFRRGAENPVLPTLTPIQSTYTDINTTPTALSIQVTSSECEPPKNLGLIYLGDPNVTNPTWSRGIWASENILQYIPKNKEAGVINSGTGGFVVFTIWISGCPDELKYHGYTSGVQFWPQQVGIESPSDPIIFSTPVEIKFRGNTGYWGLGGIYKPKP